MTVELARHRILEDGEPRLVLAGEVHYFRVPREQWGQRLDLVREVGCTTVASYVPWLWHELPDGSIDVTGATRPERDLGAFLDLCHERGFDVLVRPGPFQMAELKNEGLPYRLHREHPEIVPTGWDGVPATTDTVDYLAPAFLAETRRWFDAVLPVVAARTVDRGGPVSMLQLDNEIGMLAWVSNSPDLTDDLLADLRRWCGATYGDALGDRYPLDADWRSVVESPDEEWAAALRVDLTRFVRGRFARYVRALTALVRGHGIDVPLCVNVHGTEGGNGVPFAIGVSQLVETWAGVPGLFAGSDHYLGDLSLDVTTDLHFVSAVMAAVNGPDQPLTSLEFEAGTGDYGGGADRLYDASTVDLKARLALAQGNRLINYYLLAGGVNPRLDEPVGDGNDRISHTGERHGTAAPIGPEGQQGIAFASTRDVTHVAARHAQWLADGDEELDDLAVGFWADAFATEYRYPGSAAMSAVVEDLERHRGPGPRKALWRSLLFSGYRFSGVDLTSEAPWPTVVALSVGRVLDADVQRRLAAHVTGGGALLLLGKVPTLDLQGRPCTLLADALGVRAGEVVADRRHRYGSVVGVGAAAPAGAERTSEVRAGWFELLEAVDDAAAEPVLRDADGRVCGLEVRAGAGRAVLLCAELPSWPEVFARLATHLGAAPGLVLSTDVPGVVVTTTRTPSDDRLLHLLAPQGYDAHVTVTEDGSPLAGGPLLVPARTGHLLALGLTLPWGRLLASSAELTAYDDTSLTLAPGLGDGRGGPGIWCVLQVPVGSRVVAPDADVEVVERADDVGTGGDEAGHGSSYRVVVRRSGPPAPLRVEVSPT
ncbi:beta-galactosidase [Lapillicoccus jejuensis]|uniref:Beta-galactosidase n=1 Tax=Lapillicoccus jejuensis TaxID=402171 RepID=A0A542DYC7_9MICO|nr:beta-galactosidase [Lapillicoccus jejuensis]TQJ08088.1 beta-galactosidase [Lapillicoccus jejuensis]